MALNLNIEDNKLRNYINGEFVDPVKGQWLDNYSPKTGQVYSQIASSTAEDVNNAVAAAKKAFPAWSETTQEARSKLLYKIADLIEANLQAFAEAESKDQGKTLAAARGMDIPRAAMNFRFYAGHMLHSEEMSVMSDNTGPQGGKAVNYSVRRPYGVAALISPWNLPLYLATWKVAPAIATGNTCVLKPSELSPLTATLLGFVLTAAGVPPGVVNIIHGLGPSAGQPLVEHPDVPIISFTGGTVTGKRIAGAAAPLMKKLSLELGGKNANIIFDDCEMNACIETTLRSSFANQGEICLCGSRILVQRGVYKEFLTKFVSRVNSSIQVMDPLDPKSFYGALISKEHLAKVKSYVALAKAEGGIVHTGGELPTELPDAFKEGYFIRPVVISGLGPKARVCTEEIFGPVVTVIPFTDEAEAIALANDSPYGLSASVWSENVGRANRVATSLEVGTVWVNCWLVRDLRMPFGGMKGSGIGREGGKFAIDFYTDVKTICSKM